MSLPPVWSPYSRALILGSWPSPKSWEMSFYYGHPQNRFWPLMAQLTGRPVPDRLDIQAKKALILESGLALWDVLESCTIHGASDASIRNPVPNDLKSLFESSSIQAVFCNGATAAKIYKKYQQAQTGLQAYTLPSTSPANAAWNMQRLAQAWGSALGPWLR